MGYTTTEIPNPDLELVRNLPIDPYSPYYIPGIGEEVTGLPVGMKMGDPYAEGATGRMDTSPTLTETERSIGGGDEATKDAMKKLAESSHQGKGVPLGPSPHARRFPEQRAESPYIDIVGLAKERAKKWARIGADARAKAKASEQRRKAIMQTVKEGEE